MDFQLAISMNNAAFEDDPYELLRLIQEVAGSLEYGLRHETIFDTNGNRVGEWSISK